VLILETSNLELLCQLGDKGCSVLPRRVYVLFTLGLALATHSTWQRSRFSSGKAGPDTLLGLHPDLAQMIRHIYVVLSFFDETRKVSLCFFPCVGPRRERLIFQASP
jgi:hypothetical protein